VEVKDSPFKAAVNRFIKRQEPPEPGPAETPWADTDHDVAADMRAYMANDGNMPGMAALVQQGKRIGDGMAVVAATMQGKSFGRTSYRREYRFDGKTRYRTSLIHLADHHVGGTFIYCDVGDCGARFRKNKPRRWRRHFWRCHTR
jgi:hypothetical protein